MKILVACLSFWLATTAAAQSPELVGHVGFNVGSVSGRVESLAVTVGDGGTGPYKAILAGDPSLPTHTLYRPSDLSAFGGERLLPVVAFGNGGCRNSSGEFRNFLSDVASHGYLVVAIGPAGDAVVGGSEGKLAQTKATQLLDGVDWAAKENAREGSSYFHKLNVSRIAVMGQSCGSRQATDVSADPRVATTVLLNGGGNPGAAVPSSSSGAHGTPASRQAPGSYGSANGESRASMFTELDRMGRRYAPYAPETPPQAMQLPPEQPVVFHGSVAYINGGPSDIAYAPASASYAALKNVPALFAYENVGHYPATYREPNGGAFAQVVEAWLDWQLKGVVSAANKFLGPDCGLCADAGWKVSTKDLR